MSLAKKTVLGVAWTIVTNLGSRVVGLVGTLLLARWLDPADYGEVMGASVLATTALSFSNMGLGQFLVARPKAGRKLAFHVTFYSLLICGAMLLVTVATGERIGPFFQVTHMQKYLPWLAAVAMIDRLSSIPERILYRDMRFKLAGLNTAFGDLLYTGFSLGTVMHGAGGMSIVWGNLARSVFRCVVILSTVDRRDWLEISAITKEGTREIFSFGLPLSLGGFASFVARRWDNMLTSRYFGPAIMGAYNYAYNLADVPAMQVGESIGDVLLPSFAHLEGQKKRDGLVRSTRLLALIMFPLAVGLGAVSATLVGVFFDRRWADVAPMLTMLSALSLTRPIGYTTNSYLVSANRPMTSSLLECVKLGTLILAIVTFGRLGPLWVCGAVGLAFSLHAILGLVVVHHLDGVPIGHTVGGLIPPLLACVPLVGGVLGVRALFAHPSVICLGLEVIAGAIGYTIGALVIARSTSRDFLNLLRSVLRKRRDEPREGAAA
jgi:PST family polysaccharide transporter